MAVTLPPYVAPSTLHAASAQQLGFGRFAPAGDHGSDQAQLWPLVRRVAGGAAQNVVNQTGYRILEHALPQVGRHPQLRKKMANLIADRMWNGGYRESVRAHLKEIPTRTISIYGWHDATLRKSLVEAADATLAQIGTMESKGSLHRTVRLFRHNLDDSFHRNTTSKVFLESLLPAAQKQLVKTVDDLVTEIGIGSIVSGALGGGAGAFAALKHFLERQGVND